ncbi:SusC/RagA family TonB-linked outer membrane protein [Nafulsella turpanensis]|uniref:SusC/RagA family TonB-linked outer membrane protein n=1 Tax=Nafulsella turpanensis TaxID=1265690 RepID=UPI00034DB1D5|nr:TonB-dependent receptor [Nafulsella turpanensis]
MKHKYTFSKLCLILVLVFFGSSHFLWAQDTKTISGTVTSFSDGSALPGVTIRVKGTTQGTTTDFNGVYQIRVEEGDTLIFSFVGFTPEEVVVADQSEIDIQLMEDIETLAEVVVVGYGTQRKSDLTGAVSAITEEDFVEGFVSSPAQLITGKVAGVQITSSGGAPGSGSQIRIRGGASLNASNDPLIVVDGVPLNNATIAGASNPLSFINPEDIQAINVLKDASATAIYGSRASNGVILITTKDGKAGEKLSVTFSSSHSISVPTDQIEVLTADEYRNAVNTYGTEAQKAMLGTASTDWQDLIYRNAYSTDNNLSVSGSVESVPYRVSLGYLNQDGILLTSNFQRTSAALTVSPTFLDEHLDVDINVRGVLTNSQFADQGAVGSAIAMDPTQPVYMDSEIFGGYFQWEEAPGDFNDNATINPLSMLELKDDYGQVLRSIGNIQFDYEFHNIPDLRANLNLGYDVTESEGEVVLPATYPTAVITNGRISPYAQSKMNKLLDFYLNYTSDLEEINSRIDATAGYSYQSFSGEDPDFAETDITGEPIDGAAAGLTSFPQNNLISFFGRATYVYNERYLLTATVRRDGSSRFSEENRWGTFPSLALAWRVNEENFLVDSDVVSTFKLRVSYGVTGQQDVFGDFPYLARYTFSDIRAQYQFGDTFYTMYRPEAYDPNIKWEETTTYNAGMDFGFFEERITGSLDYYTKQTEDLLSDVPVAAGTNFSNRILTNVGNIESEGIEAVLNFYAINNERFSWEVGLNGSYNDITITNLSRVDNANTTGIPVGGVSGGTGNTVQIHTEGFSPYTFFVYKQVYDENGTPIEGLFADLNGDGEISELDRYRYQAPNANFYYGISSQFAFEDWSLSFVARGNTGNYLYNNINSLNANYANFAQPGYLRNVTRNVLETNFQDPSETVLLSDYYVENGSFLRMDNINLGYNFGRVANDRLSLRMNVNVQNVFVLTNYTGLDPEIAGGIDNNIYPRPRTYALGLHLGF